MNELKRIFTLDLRSIAVMRISIALVLIWDLIDRIVQFQHFYSIDGVIPFASAQEYYANLNTWSFHLLIENDLYQYFLFGLQLALAIVLLTGIKARLTAAASWLLFGSMIARAPALLTGGDMLMASMLFWLIWIPSGQFFSLSRKKNSTRESTFCSFATAGIILQYVVMYTLTGIYKWNPEWHDGSALFVVLDDQALSKPLGVWLTQFPEFLALLTWGTLILEVTAPILFLSPVATQRFRMVGVLSFIGLHVGIFLTMEVLGFSPVSISGLLAMIPSFVWASRPLKKLITNSSRPPDQANAASDEEIPVEPSPQPGLYFRVLREVSAGTGLAIMLFYAVWQMLVHAERVETDYRVNWIVHQIRMDQSWTMFHVPSNLCYRYLLEGRNSKGEFIDLLRGNRTRETVDDTPQIPQDAIQYESSRWLLLFRQMGSTQYFNQQQHTMRYLQKYNPAATDLPTAAELDIKEIMFHGVAGVREVREASSLSKIAHIDFRAHGKYYQGQRHGLWEHYRDNGSLDSKGTYDYGLRHGKWRFYHPNGQLASEGNFDLGHEHGHWTMFDENGDRTAHGEFIDGQKEGAWTFWYDNGGMTTGFFKDDELVR